MLRPRRPNTCQVAINRALNAMRAGAAIVVCVSHVRGYLLQPLEGHDVGPVNAALYALTSLGHAAVMVFFVLSGYFVGGSVIRDRAAGRFRWAAYLSSRTLRLWLVLIPALVLTAIVDRVGLALYPGSDLYGATNRAATQSSLLDFVGNALFLQTNLVPTFGSNGPLWSLGYEFAYYLIFPLVLVGVLGRHERALHRALSGLAVLAILVLAGPLVAALLVTWLAGAAIAWRERALLAWVESLSSRARGLLRGGALVALGGAMVLDKVQGGTVDRVTPGTYATAACAAVLVILYLSDAHPSRPWAASALGSTRHFAESSYSLYAYHLPVLALVATALTPHGPTGSISPDPMGWALVVTVTLALIGGGWLFARCTEHYYKPLRRRVFEVALTS